MSFDENQELYFGVHTRPGFRTRYLNVEISHTVACKKTSRTPSPAKNCAQRGISICLDSLTTRKSNNEDKSLSDLYPKTHYALKQSDNLKNNRLPKLDEIIDK